MNVTVNKQNDLSGYQMSDDTESDLKTAIEVASQGTLLMPVPVVLRNSSHPLCRSRAEFQSQPSQTEINEISLYTNLLHSIVQINGADRTAKLYNNKGKLLLIVTCKNHIAQFNTGHLKKGVYYIEANHNIFEFVK